MSSKQLDQAMAALKACQEVLADIDAMAGIAREAGRESITIYLDDDGVLPELRVALFNAELAARAYAKQQASARLVSQWAADTMGLPVLAGRAE